MLQQLCFHLKEKTVVLFSLLFLSLFTTKGNAQCDPNDLYDKVVSGYHSTIALKSDGVLAVWGQTMANNGSSDLTSPLDINAVNFPNLGAATPIKGTIGGIGGGGKDQMILLASDGLYAWGPEGYVLNTSLTASSTFAKITAPAGGDAATGLPAGIAASDIASLFASYKTLVILTKNDNINGFRNGQVWVLTQASLALEGNGGTPASAGSSTWVRVKSDAGTFLTNIIAARGEVSDDPTNYSALAALSATGTVYTWGNSTYTGDGSAKAARSYATLMTLPAEFTSSNRPKMIGITGGTKNTASTANTYYLLSQGGNLYSLGDNSKKQCGDFTTTERTTWVNAKMNASTNFTNINFISPQEHTGGIACIGAITKDGQLYTWGENDGELLARGSGTTANYDPGIAAGSGGSVAVLCEMGGHTFMYVSVGSDHFCYAGHQTNGSMGCGACASVPGTVTSFDCINPPIIPICGSVPVAPSTTLSTIAAVPVSIPANGTSTSGITVQLKDASGNNLTTSGGIVVINTNAGSISATTDNNDGTYGATLTSSNVAATATLGFTINGANATNTATVDFTSAGGTISLTGTLNSFSACAGTTSTEQTLSVSATGLTASLDITAPAGYEVSLTSGSGFMNSLSLTPSGGNIAASDIYVRLASTASNGASGSIFFSSTGATTISVTTGTAVIHPVPTIATGTISNINPGANSFDIPYTSTTGSPDEYTLIAGTPALPGFVSVINSALVSSPIVTSIPVSAPGTYGFDLTVRNSSTGCTATTTALTLTINPVAQVNTPANQVVNNGNNTTAVTFTTTNTTGTTTYSWTNSNPSIGLGASGNGNLPSFTAVNNGTAPIVAIITVTPTYTNGGASATGPAVTFTITINPTAQVNTPANQVVCTGSSTSPVTFTTQNTGGVTSYAWTNNNTSIGLPASGSGNLSGFIATNTGTTVQVATITIFPTYTNAGQSNQGPAQSFSITVNPAIAITCPANIVTGNTPGQCGKNVTYPAAVAIGSPAPVVTYSIPSGSFFPTGVTTVTATATNSCGTATCSFTVTVNDVEQPVFTCPNTINATAIGACTAIVNYTTPVATDNCAGVTVTRIAGPASGSAFPLGTTTITHRATDAAGNYRDCSFNIIVVDGQIPSFVANPVNQTVCESVNATFNVTVTNAVAYQWQSWTGTAWNNISGANTASLTLPSTTASMNTYDYRVQVTGLCTNATSNYATLYVNFKPQVSLSASGSTSMLPGQTQSISAMAFPAGGTYAWYKNGVLINGQIQSTLTGLTVDDQGAYSVRYTDRNGCSATPVTALELTAQASEKLYVYPNPNNGKFNIRFFNRPNENVQVRVYDNKGALAYSRSTKTSLPYTSLSIDLEKMGIPPGEVYIVEIRGEDGRVIDRKKIITMR